MPLTPEQIAQMDEASGINTPTSTLTPDIISQMDAASGLGQPEEGVASDLAKRGQNIRNEIGQTLTGEKPLVNLPFRYAREIGGGAADIGGRALSAITPDVIEEPIKEYAGKAMDYIAESAPGQAVGEMYGAARELAPNVMDTTEGALALGGMAPTGRMLAKGAGAPVEAAAQALTPDIPEGLADIASIAQKHDIPLSLPQVTESRALGNVQKISQELPFSGEAKFRDAQLSKWQEKLFETTGVKADRFNPQTMGEAFKKVGGEFDALTKGKKFNVADRFLNNVAELADDADALYGTTGAKVIQTKASDILKDFDKDGNISGESLSFHRRRINKLGRRTTEEGNKAALQDLENSIIDSITSGDPILNSALTKAKHNYKNLIVLEPLAVKAKKGFINPTLLNQRVSNVYGRAHTVGKSGDIGELGRIGHELLGELGGSDTVQKGLYAGAALGSGYMQLPATVTALAGNRALQSKVLRNQALVGKKIKKALK